MKAKVLLITPPFTQLNTPYPATVYLKGFLNSIGVSSFQADLGIDLIGKLFSNEGLSKVFSEIERSGIDLSENTRHIVALKNDYLKTIDPIIAFLQNKKPTLANLICSGNYLPQAARFHELADLEWAFGTMGIQDKAKHLATLYLEDLGDLISEALDPHFGFSRYAEHLGRYAYEFDEIQNELEKPLSFIDSLLIGLLEQRINSFSPDLLAISVPFPGNLFGAFRCAQWVKEKHPVIKIAMGGGFANTELRSLNEIRVFNYFDFVCLDDGELPLRCILEHMEGTRNLEKLKRSFVKIENKVLFIDGCEEKDYRQTEIGTPDYTDLELDKYLSVIEIANPMHRLWSDGRWNKLTLAHGCYWANCSFCDTSLDYISRFEPSKARFLVDRIEEIIRKTDEYGFHFVDEAAPPSLLRELALEIIRRNITVVWWTNIRFEKNYTSDLCRLLALSGCIAVSGGLEVASDRLLKLINKGVDIEQVAISTNAFTQAGIMVHAYLMFGYPTQTEQETVDSLEIVRQLFEAGIVQSGFWHRFALTVHSHVAAHPDYYRIKINKEKLGNFANNDLEYSELKAVDHEKFSEGLRISLFNYMHGVGFDFPLKKWFNFKIPPTTVLPSLIENYIQSSDIQIPDSGKRLVWIGNIPEIQVVNKMKKGKSYDFAELCFSSKSGIFRLKFDQKIADWIVSFLKKVELTSGKPFTIKQMEEDFEQVTGQHFLLFVQSRNFTVLRENGLFIL